uniref:Cytochrome P450 n=1 Tax=Oryctolagus cuniculus TaxID=9986 RepID=G1U925_RABIT
MEFSLLLLLAFLAGLLLLLLRGHPKAHSRLSPGPPTLPILGNLLQMDRKGLLRSFLRLREKHGDVFTVYLGSRPVVVLCGTDAIREALVDQAEAFSGRGKIAVVDPIFQGYGVIFANGERWRALRRFSLATMRDFGMGKRSVEERIQEEARCLVEELRKSKGALLDNTLLFHSVTSNIICSIVFGKRFDYKDPVLLRLLEPFCQSSSLISSFSSQVFELFSGFLKHFPGTHRQIYRNLQEINTFITQSVEKHRATLDPSNPRDFIDIYLLHMEKDKSDPSSEFHHQNLILTVLSLFFAGTEIASTTLRYGFLLLLKYPHVTGGQWTGSCVGETLGSGMAPAEPVLRVGEGRACGSELDPLGPHPQSPCTLPGPHHPFVLSLALHDPRYFETPNTFNPGHFLDADGALKRNEGFMPFSLGKRICLGEGIARTELFLFFTTILQNFSIASPVYQIRFLAR